MWTRPSGAPQEWKKCHLIDSCGKLRKFSLQELPKDRYDEALEYMCTIFLRDDVLFDFAEDPEAVHTMSKAWKIAMEQGISVGAFEILDAHEKPPLAGVNILMNMNDEAMKILLSIELQPEKILQIITFTKETSDQADPIKILNLNTYLMALGLCVHPKYRRMGLGQKLLELRSDIGKEYDIEYSSTLFTNPTSQKIAEKAGFETKVERPYDEAIDDDHQLIFPKLKGKTCKIMWKKLK